MARIKYFDPVDNTWKYADDVLVAAPVLSVNGKTGAVTVTAADTGAEPSGAVNDHNGDTAAHGDLRALMANAMMKSDIFIKKAKLTLEDGSEVLIDVVVASEGTTILGYTNQVPLSTDTDGSIFNGVGYQTDYRLSSSGATKAETYSAVTGFIPAQAGDVVRISGCGWHHARATNYLCAYKADRSFLGAVTSNETMYSTQIYSSVSLGEEMATVTLADVADIAYIRVSSVNDGACDLCLARTPGSDMIVTINQEIT